MSNIPPTDPPPIDPMSFFRDFVTQWESAANDVGSKLLGSSQAAQAMQAGTSLSLKAQQAAHEAMAKGLAAANMPSKADVEALGARLFAIEAHLGRIEAMMKGQSTTVTEAAPPKPKRTKTPPVKTPAAKPL